MKPILIISLLACLCLSSCATSKNTETNQQTDYSNELQQLRNSLDSLHFDMNKQSQITTDKLSNLKVENTTVYLSKPDSTGKQYPIKQSTTQLNKQDEEHTDEYQALAVSITQISNQLDSLNNKIKALANKQETIKELSWWDLHKDKIYISLLVLLLIMTIWLKIKK